MSYHTESGRLGTYWDFTDGEYIDDMFPYMYVIVGEKPLQPTTMISTVWLAERGVPKSNVKELCVIKETDATIHGDTLIKSSNKSVKLKDYLLQLKRLSHENLVEFYGYAKTPGATGTFNLVLVYEYCPGMLPSCGRLCKPTFSPVRSTRFSTRNSSMFEPSW